MSTENNSGKFKVLIGILSVLLIALAVYTVTLFNDSKTTVTGLEKEKAEIEQELQGLIANYDEVIKDNDLKDKDLLAARERITVLLDSVKGAQANVGLIARYKAEVNRLKSERTMMFKRADSLIASNRMLLTQRDSTQNELTNTRMVVDSVTETNTAMSERIKKGSIVKATDLRGEAVIVRNSGKVVDTKRSSRADKVRACFTLAPNTIAEKGDRTLYVQVINPKNNMLGQKATKSFETSTLMYSESSKVFYENDELDVCITINATEAELVEGRYIINLFDGKNLIATSTMDLK